jgi:hypothetical protein
MKRILMALCALSICGVASAQYDDELANSAVGFSLRIGGYFPADDALRDIESTFINVGLEYELERSWMRNGQTFVAAEWIASEIMGGDHVLNVTFNQRIYTKNQRFAAGGSPYFFAGLGGQWTHIPGTNDETTWVIRGGLGSEFQGNYFIEVGGYFSPDTNGFNTSGICASLGYRFKG